jgi:hypothetical protein
MNERKWKKNELIKKWLTEINEWTKSEITKKSLVNKYSCTWNISDKKYKKTINTYVNSAVSGRTKRQRKELTNWRKWLKNDWLNMIE